MKTKKRVLVSIVLLFLAVTGYSQNCLCSPPIPSKCLKPCFDKKLSSNAIGKDELKTLLMNANTAIKDTVKIDYSKVADKLIRNSKDNNKALEFQLTTPEQKAVDKLMNSKELRSKLEK